MIFETLTLKELTREKAIDIKTGPFGTQLKASDYVPEGIPVLNVRNIGFGNVVEEKLERISQETAQRLSAHLLAINDIIFGRKGAVERHAFIGESCNGWLQGSDCIRLRVLDKTKVLPRYLSYFFLTTEHKNRMMSLCSHGSTMASLNQSILEVIEIPHTSIENQEAIVSLLTPLDDKIELNNRIIANLEALAQVMLDSVFSIDYLPEISLKQIMSFVNGYAFKSTSYKNEGLYSIITIKNVQDGDISIDNTSYINELPRDMRRDQILGIGDVLLSLTGNVGRVGIVIESNLLLNQRVAKLQAKNKSTLSFCYFFLRKPSVKKSIENLAKGTAQKNLSTVELSEFKIKGTEELIAGYSKFADPLFVEITNLKRENRILSNIRDTLLPKLMSGEIEVPVEE